MLTQQIWSYNSQLPSSLILLRSLATFDELLSAMVLWHLLKENKQNPALYLGASNESSFTRELILKSFPHNFWQDLRFYQPKPVTNRQVIQLHLKPTDISNTAKVTNLNWVQTNERIDLQIDFKTKPNLDQSDITISSTRKEFFPHIYLFGSDNFSDVDGWSALNQAIDTKLSKITRLSANYSSASIPETSVADILLQLSKKNNWSMSANLTKALMLAKENGQRFYQCQQPNISANTVESSTAIDQYLHCSPNQYAMLLDFWLGKLSYQYWSTNNSTSNYQSDLEILNLTSLILLYPEINKFSHAAKATADSTNQNITRELLQDPTVSNVSDWSLVACSSNFPLEKYLQKNNSIRTFRTFPEFKLAVLYRN